MSIIELFTSGLESQSDHKLKLTSRKHKWLTSIKSSTKWNHLVMYPSECLKLKRRLSRSNKFTRPLMQPFSWRKRPTTLLRMLQFLTFWKLTMKSGLIKWSALINWKKRSMNLISFKRQCLESRSPQETSVQLLNSLIRKSRTRTSMSLWPPWMLSLPWQPQWRENFYHMPHDW